MAYNNFTTEKLFEDESINILCNRIWENLILVNDLATVNANFCLTGSPAKIVQGAGASLIKVVPFATGNAEIFTFCSNTLPSLINAKGAIKLTDRVQIVFDNVYFEIWYLTPLGTINTVSNLRVHNTADIPAYIS